MQKGNRFGAVVLLGAWPDDDSIGHGVDIEHLRDLLAALLDILLVYTYGVNPEDSWLIFMAEV